MGVVYQAHDRRTGATVAVKVLGDGAHEDRFAREAEVLAQLRHPAIVSYVAHGGRSKDAPPYLAMGWLEGEDLAARIARGPLPVEEAITVAARVADAVGTAHARGIIHRDLKPTNVFLVGGRADGASVLDFGLAREGARQSGRRPLTAAGAVMGTVGYLAPEQARGSDSLDARCDVFALGCVLFECLTGAPAFTGGHAVAVLAKLLVEDAPRVRSLRPEAPGALDALVARMLERNPDRRPSDGFATRDALLRVSDASSTASLRPGVSLRPSALGRDEQRMMAVILVGESRIVDASSDSTVSSAATMVSLGAAETRAAIERSLSPFGAAADVAADGTVVVTLRGGGAGADQAARAARCALAIRAVCPGALIALALGLGVTGSGPASGEVIERAASLLTSAMRDPSDGVHVEAEVVPLLEPRFVVAPGRAGMLLHAERHALESARVLLGRVTPFVGRAREMATLEQAVAVTLAEREASAVIVVGAAGSGKSRLREELVRAAKRRDSEVVVRIAQGDALRARSPFAAAATIVRAACGIDDAQASPDALRAAIARRVAQTLERAEDRERVTCFLAEMTGCADAASTSTSLRLARDSAQLMNDQITRAWVDFVGAELERAPLLLVLDDLHWVDAPTTQLVDAALAAHREQPLVVVGLGRPEALQTLPGLWAAHFAPTITLAPLSARAAEKLVREALHGASTIDDRAIARVVARAEGNPFVLEELVRALAVAPDDEVALPAGVLALVQTRLEALDPSLRRVLRAASVFGRAAHEEGIARLLGDDDALDLVRSSLRVLVQREVLETAVHDPGLVRFRHDLVRDAAYAMLTAADRAVGHGLAGAWLEARGEHDASLLAMHFDLAGEAPRAATWFARAAEQALEGNDSDAVIARATRALSLGAAGELRGRALHARALATRWRNDCASGLDDALAALNEFATGSAMWFSAIFQACILGDVVGRRDVVDQLVEVALATEPGDARGRALRIRIMGEAASSRHHTGDHAGGDAFARRVELEGAPLMDDPVVALTVHRMRANFADLSDDPYGEVQHWHAIGELYARAGDRRGCAVAAINIGYGLMMLGAYERAESALREGIRLAEELRLARAVAAGQHNLGLVLAHRGDFEGAIREETAALEAMAAARDDRLTAVSRVYLAMILEMAGDLERAETVVRQALPEVATLPPVAPRAFAVLARILLRRGELHEAGQLMARAAEVMRVARIEGGDVYPRLALAETLFAAGRIEEGKAALRGARRAVERSAACIADDATRAAFLACVPENARTLALAHEHGVE